MQLIYVLFAGLFHLKYSMKRAFGQKHMKLIYVLFDGLFNLNNHNKTDKPCLPPPPPQKTGGLSITWPLAS